MMVNNTLLSSTMIMLLDHLLAQDYLDPNERNAAAQARDAWHHQLKAELDLGEALAPFM